MNIDVLKKIDLKYHFGRLNMKKVSIIIPCFNKGKYLEEALQSALNQTYENIELVCVDDCSDDNSREIFKQYVRKYKRIIYIENDINKGVVYSRNMAIEAATGEYIFPLDADDIISNDCIECMVNVLEKNPDAGVVYCKMKTFGAKKEKVLCGKFTEEELLYDCVISASSMFRKKDFVKIGGYKECMFHGCEDWELWLNFYERGYKFEFIDKIMIHYRQIKSHQRTSEQIQHDTAIKYELLKNHLELYKNNKEFISKIFNLGIRKKYIKYKLLFTYLAMGYIFLLMAGFFVYFK